MTGPATSPLPAVTDDDASIRERHARIAAKMEAFIDRVIADGPDESFALEAYYLADQAAELRVEYRNDLARRFSYAELVEAARRRMEADAAAVIPAPRSHRKGRQPPLMRVLKGGLAAFAAAAGWAGLRRAGAHVVRGHLAAKATAAVMLVGGTSVVAATVVIHAQNAPDVTATAGPAAVAQVPDLDPPGPSRLIAAVAAHHKHAVTLVIPDAAPPVSAPSSPATPSTPPASPSLSWSQPPQPPPPDPGTLQVTDGNGNAVTQVDVSSGQPATVTLTATGGPVQWDASSSSPDVTLAAFRANGMPLSRLHGWLWPGRTVTLTITPVPAASQDGAQQATVTIAQGVGVTVTLVAQPAVAPSPASS
jgi:hypothetical protein